MVNHHQLHQAAVLKINYKQYKLLRAALCKHRAVFLCLLGNEKLVNVTGTFSRWWCVAALFGVWHL